MPSSDHWVCFECRKQLRKPLHQKRSPEWLAETQSLRWKRKVIREDRSCPECGAALVNMGKYFRPPRRENKQEWENVRRLADHGIRFTSAGMVAYLRFVGGARFDKEAVDRIIACCPCHTRTEGQRLLLKIAREPAKPR